MFGFIIKYLGFLKFIPGLPHLFDAWLKSYTFITKPVLLDWMDDITDTLKQLPDVKISTHKYGGTQFNYHHTEIGHIHGNGLLDMLLSRKVKKELMLHGRVQDHHSFKNTGWISFYIHTADDKNYAIQLLQLGYDRLKSKQ